VDDRGGAAERATLTQRYQRAEQMAGLLPIGRSSERENPMVALFWSVRGSDVEAVRARGLTAWRDEWTRLWPEAEDYAAQITDWDSFSFATYRHRTLRRPVGERLVHIGDSWHSTSPQLGQGANMALLDAFALARGLAPGSSLEDGLADFARARSTHVRLYQLMSLVLTPFYQSGGRIIPAIRDHVVGPLSAIPAFNRLQAAIVAGLVGGPLARLGLGHSGTFTDRHLPR
jgi:2-polyprenyl-6-methoxyphenol hydroxylase-like FAD-dependent oxidoreductase